ASGGRSEDSRRMGRSCGAGGFFQPFTVAAAAGCEAERGARRATVRVMSGARLPSALVCFAIAAAPSCAPEEPPPPPPPRPSAPEPAPAPAPEPAKPAARERVTLLAGGDVSFGRLVGQMLLKDPSLDFFPKLKPWLDAADVRFANLEGPLSDQHGQTVR